MSAPLVIVHKDAHFLVVDKPQGIATTSPAGGECLMRLASRTDVDAPALHPVSRLDAEVSGLVTFARTREANLALQKARATGRYRRLYLGLAAAAPSPAEGCWQAPISIDPRNPRRRIGGAVQGKGERQAATDYASATVLDQAALLWLRPRTGRTHQLRVHCALAGAPLLGDRHYGGPMRLVRPDGSVIRARRVMLHCARLVLPDLAGGSDLVIAATPPEDMVALWRALGGKGQIPLPQ